MSDKKTKIRDFWCTVQAWPAQRKMSDKKAQIGTTMTWMLATIVIIILLLISVYIAGGSDIAKKLFGLNKEVSYIKSSDVIAEKSFFSYLLCKDDGQTFYEVLDNDLDFNSENGMLAEKIFKELYDVDAGASGEYKAVWVGFYTSKIGLSTNKNEYFGSKPSTRVGGDLYSWHIDSYKEDVGLMSVVDPYFSMYLFKKEKEEVPDE